MMMENPGNYPVDERNPQLEEHYRQILGLLGEDAEREGLVKTPQRVARAMQTLTRGYRMDPHANCRRLQPEQNQHFLCGKAQCLHTQDRFWD